MHFKDAKHTYMLKCLGIVNSDLFLNVSKINEVLELDRVIKSRSIKEGKCEEEVEDVLGNVYLQRL